MSECTCKPPTFEDMLSRLDSAATMLTEHTNWRDRAEKAVQHARFEYQQLQRKLRDHNDTVEARLRRAEKALKAIGDLCDEQEQACLLDDDPSSSDAMALARTVRALLPEVRS